MGMIRQTGKRQASPSFPTTARIFSFRRGWIWGVIATAVVLAMIFGQRAQLEALGVNPKTSDITGYYQFTIGDTLAILDQHGNLQGHFDVFQPHEVPKPVLSYSITRGSVRKNHLEFKTEGIYGKHYRFSGTVERGVGKDPGDYDYIQLAGTLEKITDNSAAGKREVDSHHVVFKSLAQDREGS